MSDLTAFIALWNKNFGAKLIDLYPKSLEPKFDLEFVTSKIFFAYQHLSEDKSKMKTKSFFKLPFREINRKALVLLEVLESTEEKEDNNHPFIVVLLFPGFISDEELDSFKGIIAEIRNDYLTTKNFILGRHLKKIEELFLLEEQIRDSEISIDETYSLNNALSDFKNGIELFSKNKNKEAYYFLKKAYLKFYDENQTKLILESTFFLSSLLSQLNKFNVAHIYIENLENLSDQLKHQKYYETALFLSGFINYKIENYEDALKKFKKLESINPQHINKFNFYLLYGRVLRVLEQNVDAAAYLQKALEQSSTLEDSKELREKKAQILLELGHIKYISYINSMISGILNQSLSKSAILKSIEYYESAIEFYYEIENYSGLISIYRLIGSIYSIIDENLLSIKYYRQALKFAEQINDVTSRLQIFNLIIQNLLVLEKYDIIIKETDEMLSKTIAYAYVDLFTISTYHKYLGEALFKLGKDKWREALSELLISLNIYNKFDEPVLESLDVLQMIIKIYEHSNDADKNKYLQYYTDQYQHIKTKIDSIKRTRPTSFSLVKEVKEFWIFTLEGRQLYAHAPETNFNPELFGGFLSAMQNFSMELASKNLKSITIGLDQYVIFKEEKPFYVLGRASCKTSLYNIEIILKLIYDNFWEIYQKILTENDIETSRFSNFFEKFKELNFKDGFS
ncbi:MAG: tetratricopeptide repeat protein [Promethearchaeota archaeon]